MSFKKIFITILILGFIAVTMAGIWYWHSNSYSEGALKLEIIAKDEVDLAEKVEYLVKYKNNGNIRLENPKLIFEFPEYTLTEKQRKEIELDDINPGQEKTVRFEGRILGTENSAKVAKAWLSYRPKNLNARFESKTTHTTVLNEVLLTFNFDLPSMVKPDSDIDFNFRYFSNVDYPLSNLRARVNYPSGFEFKESRPQGLSKDKWKVGLLNKAEGGNVKISGKLNGKNGEQKIFKGELGMWQDGEFVPLKKSAQGLEMGEPSLHISQKINGKSDYIASPGETLHYEISFRNMGEQAFQDMFLAVKLSSKGFDYSSLKSPRGQFQQGDNTIVFDSDSVPGLQLLEVGQKGKVEFWIDLKKNWQPEKDQPPTLNTEVLLSDAREDFSTKVESGLALNQGLYYKNEVFPNKGPIPPEVGETTNYTIMWRPKTTFNKIENVKVESGLPEWVQTTGEIFPEEESSKFSYDSSTGEITWEVEELNPSATTTPNVSFQVELTPNSSHQGTTPVIIEESKIIGTDTFTENEVSATSSPADTTLPGNDSVSEEDGVVK